MTCGEKLQTLSAVIPWFNELLNHAERYQNSALAEIQWRSDAGTRGTVSRRNRGQSPNSKDPIDYDQGMESATGRTLDGMVDLSETSGDALDDVRDAAEAAFDKLEQYFDISSDYCAIAVILDPRHKLDFFEDDSNSAEENKAEREK